MKGVVIAGGRAPAADIILRYIQGAALCVAADSGLETALRAGIRPDYVVGDMDSLSDTKLLSRFADDRVLRMSRDKDLTDTEAALQLLESRGCSEKILIGASGGRLDHVLAVRSLFDRPLPPTLWVGEESVAVGIGAPFPYREISPGKLDGVALISVFPCGSSPYEIRGIGLKWPIDRLDWAEGQYSLSNRCEEGPCVITALQGSFMVILAADARFTVS